jgi:predicted permease
LQRRLIVGEIAAALLLLIGSSLLVKSFVRVLNVPFGFNPEGAVVVRTVFDRPRYPEAVKREAVQKELLNRLSQLPGVTSVAAASHLPLSDARQIGFRLEHAAANDFHWAENSMVSPGYFGVMGISVLHGRDFTYEDGHSAPPAAIVNEAFVRRFLAGQDAIGQRFNWGDRALFTIIGVVNDVRISALDADPPPMIYDSMFQVESGASARTAFVVRVSQSGRGTEQGLYNAIKQQIWSVDKDLPTYDTTTLAALVSESVAQRRFTTMLMGSFAAVALMLAAVGLFGVISYVVSERRRELAVRIALGARRSSIGWMILQNASIMAVTGCGIGLLAFAAASRLVRSNLYQVSAYDPLTLCLAPVALIGIALLAAYWPARRAMRSDPMAALRYE